MLDAHWQNGKAEHHGSFLQAMLTKVDREHPVSSYEQLQTALNQRTHAKNSLSIRHGYAPEVIVFGKHARLPGSVLSDESLPSHESIPQEEDTLHPSEFRRMLQIRESSRRAFHAADNLDTLRCALVRRSCPVRGPYEPGQWVMIWRANQQRKPSWIGPHRVILQEDNGMWEAL